MRPSGSDLDQRRRLDLAKVSGAAARWAFGEYQDRPQAEAVAAIQAISPDPLVLGLALGAALAAVELDGWPSYGRLAALYRAAGADEQVAAANLDWQRGRADYRGSD